MAVFKLFTSKDQTLLLWWNTFFILNFRFDILDSVVGFNVKGNGFSGQGFNENLHSTTSQTKDQVKSTLLLNVVLAQSTSIFKLFTSEDQTLLFRWNTFFILNLRLDILDCVVGFHVKGDGFSSQGFNENLHGTTSQTKDQVKSTLLLNVVVAQSTSIFKLFTSEDQTLLFRWNTFFVLNLRLD